MLAFTWLPLRRRELDGWRRDPTPAVRLAVPVAIHVARVAGIWSKNRLDVNRGRFIAS